MQRGVKVSAPCFICPDVTCNSYHALWLHVLGNDHKKRVLEANPHMATSLNSLQYFLDTCVLDYPLLGLEYIVEFQEEEYKYACNLCEIHFDYRYAVRHVLDIMHMKRYMGRHHPIEVNDMYDAARDAATSVPWHETALEVHRRYGRRAIQEVCLDHAGPPPAKVDWGPSAKTLRQRRRNQNKERRLITKEAKAMKILLRWKKTVQFQSNEDFLDYVRDFEIHNEGDAEALKDLIQSCTAALGAFWDKELNGESTQVPPSSVLPGASTDPTCQGGDSHGLQDLNKDCSFSGDDDTSESE